MDDNTIIATRTLICLNPKKRESIVTISITKPQKASDSDDWSCYCSVSGTELQDHMCVFGADSIQALLLSIDALRAKLGYFRKKGYTLRWHVDTGDHLS